MRKKKRNREEAGEKGLKRGKGGERRSHVHAPPTAVWHTIPGPTRPSLRMTPPGKSLLQPHMHASPSLVVSARGCSFFAKSNDGSEMPMPLLQPVSVQICQLPGLWSLSIFGTLFNGS